MAATGADPDHSITEDRYITFGVSDRGRLLVVAHTEEDETIRIISARLASKGERKIYHFTSQKEKPMPVVKTGTTPEEANAAGATQAVSKTTTTTTKTKETAKKGGWW